MELYQSNAVLLKEPNATNPSEWDYMLYSITMLDHSQYVPEAYTQTVYTLNSEGHYEIDLEVKKDANIPIDMEYLKPVVHIVELNGITLNSDTPTIEVNVKENGQVLGKKRRIHKSSADENARPI